MNWLQMMANLPKNMNRKMKGHPTQTRRSKSSNADPPQSMTRTLKSQSTSAMERKSSGLVESMRSLSIGRNRVRSAVRIPVRSKSTNGVNQMQTLEDICYFMESNNIKKVVVMAGAGISTSSGIPDFRSPGTGLYDNLRQYKIPYPEAIFDIDYFHYNPRPFFTLAKDLYPNGIYQPNIVHYFCRLLYDKGMLLRMYTQNIDGLERSAGIPADKLVEAHGTFATATCVNCRRKYDGEEIKHEIITGKLPLCRTTLSCTGIIKPDIVFFGEELPKRFWYYLKDLPQADMLLVMGTSLEVEPFAGLVDYVRFPVPRILFNLKAVGPFTKRRRMNDVVIKGDLVKNIALFTRALGWQDDYSSISGGDLPPLVSSSDLSDSGTRIGATDHVVVRESESKTESDGRKNGIPGNETSMAGSQGSRVSKGPDSIFTMKRNETPIIGKVETVTNNQNVTTSKRSSDSSQVDNSRRLHTASANNRNRLLTKRGSTGSLLQKTNSTTRTYTTSKPTLPKLSGAQRRVDAYKETLEKLRLYRIESSESSSNESESSDSSSD